MSDSPEIATSPSRHDRHYIDNDGFATFLVEDRLFKMPRYALQRESVVFRDMFSLPTSPPHRVEGLTDEMPIRLEGASAIDFERLLELLYPSLLDEFKKTWSCAEWSSIARIAHQYQLDRVQGLAIDRVILLADVDPIGLIVLARKLDNQGLLRAAYFAFAKRKDFLLPSESNRLGPGETLNLTRFREIARWADPSRFPVADKDRWKYRCEDMPNQVISGDL